MIKIVGILSVFALFYILKRSDSHEVIVKVQLCISSLIIISGIIFFGIEYLLLKVNEKNIFFDAKAIIFIYLKSIFKYSPIFLSILFLGFYFFLIEFFSCLEFILVIITCIVYFPIVTYSILLKRKKNYIFYQLINTLIPNVVFVLFVIVAFNLLQKDRIPIPFFFF